MNSPPKIFFGNPLARTAAPSPWSVRTLLIWLVLACLLPGVIGASILFIYQYQAGSAQLEKSTLQTTRALVQAVDNYLLKVQAVAQALTTSKALASHDLARFHQRAREIMTLAGLGTNVIVRNETGQQILNTAVEFGAPLPRDAAPGRLLGVFKTGQTTISDLHFGQVLQRPIIDVVVPVMQNGKVVYALSIGILPDRFNAILKAQNLPPGWVAAVFDSAGIVVGRTHDAKRFVGQKASDKLFQRMAESSEGAIEATTLEGIPVSSFYSRSPVTRWHVAIGIPNQALAAPLVRTLILLAVGVSTLFGAGLLLAWRMSGKIARSVKALIAPAIALGHGASVPVPRVEVKETADVAAAIGRAAGLLQERAVALRARDAELAEAHRLAKFGTWHWDLATGDIEVSDSVREICRRDIPAFPEMRDTLLNIESWERVKAAAQNAMLSGKGFDLELQVMCGGGDTIWINSKCKAIRNEKGEVDALRGTIQDITERKRAEQRVREASLHDVLTGLPNRALVFEYCSHLLAAARRNHRCGALLFIDLDRFKPINDLYGHEIGDRVLQAVGQRLVDCTRHEDLVGRLGGDEFVIVLPYLDADHHRAAIVAQHVIDRISEPFRIDALELSISSSIGISHFPEHATEVSALLHTADLAMYQAKQSGRANFQLYTSELDRRADQALSLEMRLKNALRQDGLTLHYQPVIELKSGKLIGAEALVRLADHGGEDIGPDRFIPIAESIGLIGELGEWVTAEACRQHAVWQNAGLKIVIAVNVSPLQFRQRAFAEKLGNILAAAKMDPAYLEIEVTESTLMESVDDAVEILNRIKSLGAKVALDDFGTGYSSLSSLSNLPLDKLKVDQSFVRRIERDPASRAVTDAIIALGRSLRLEVVAEGIESENALRYLQEHGCNQAQGFWFSQPLPPSAFVAWHQAQSIQREAALSVMPHNIL